MESSRISPACLHPHARRVRSVGRDSATMVRWHRSRARTRARLARQPPAARCDLGRGEHQLRGLRPGGDRRRAVPVRRGSDGTEVETRYTLTEQTLGIWHGACPGCRVGQRYGFRADGPWEPARGLRVQPGQAAARPLRPRGQRLGGPRRPDLRLPRPRPDRRVRAAQPGRAASATPRRTSAQRWSCTTTSTGATTTRSGRARVADTVIYELHVKGFTAAARPRCPRSSAAPTPGWRTAAVIDYLKRPRRHRRRAAAGAPVRLRARTSAQRGLTNYWGYNSIGFFAPHAAYSSSGDRGQQVTEFKQMVKALHAAGLEVILDVVYNHTAEGGAARADAVASAASTTSASTSTSRTRRARPSRRRTGTSPAAATPSTPRNPPALRLILDSLRYWVTEMHVDGFRFDLTSGADPHRPRGRHARRTAHHDRPGPGAAAREADRRAVGRLAWTATGSGEFPPPWVRVERPVPRHHPRLLARVDSGRDPRRRHPAGRLLGPVRRRRPLAVRLGQLRDRPRRLHAARPGVLRPQAQRGQRRATTATAPTTTGPGTAASRARPTTRRSSRCGAGRPRT